MITKVASFIQNNQLIKKNDIIVTAVSGGRDSMALLYLLNSLKDELSFELRACHINHGVRDVDSDLDEKLVQKECSLINVPLQVEKLSGFGLNSNEDILRRARYDIFQSILAQDEKIKIATAHHLDDQLETFFMRLAKGSYHKGLTAIPVARPGFIRPFLGIGRNEIDTFVSNNKISYRDDYTNEDTTKLRNNIRHNITPAVLAVFGESFYKGFEKSISDLKATYDDYKKMNYNIFASIVTEQDGVILFLADKYQKFSDNRKRIFTEYCISLFNPLNSFLIKYSFSEFNRFVKTANTGALFYFSKDLYALKNRDEIRLMNVTPEQKIDILLNCNSSVEVQGTIFEIKEVKGKDVKFSADKSVEYICGDGLDFPLQLRNWQFGDLFFPLGMEKKQKLSDFFINEKIAADRKKEMLVLRNGDEIVWLVGMRLDNRYKLKDQCKRIIRISQKRRKSDL